MLKDDKGSLEEGMVATRSRQLVRLTGPVRPVGTNMMIHVRQSLPTCVSTCVRRANMWPPLCQLGRVGGGPTWAAAGVGMVWGW